MRRPCLNCASPSTAGNTLWALSDHLGSIRDIADLNESTGVTTIANHRTLTATGTVVAETNAAVDLLFAFTGKQLDNATGLQHNLFRWYDSVRGQWLSEDPIGFAADDENTRCYARNSLTEARDPSGLWEDPGVILPNLLPGNLKPPVQWAETVKHIEPITVYPSQVGMVYNIPRTLQIDDFGFPTTMGAFKPEYFLKWSVFSPTQTAYGCGGIMAIRAGIPFATQPQGYQVTNPMGVTNLIGATAFGSLKKSLVYHRDIIDGQGLVVILQSNRNRLQDGSYASHSYKTRVNGQEELSHQKLTGDFQIPAAYLDPSITTNFVTLQGTATHYYWEDATGPWSSGGIIRHLERFDSEAVVNVFVVVPGTPSRSPIVPRLINNLLQKE